MKTPPSHGDESTLYVVSYDIPNDRRRTRVHSALTGFGTWVQYSVYLLSLNLGLERLHEVLYALKV